MVQVEPWPTQGPLQPPKIWPVPGEAESVTCVPAGNWAEQAALGQFIPGGLLVTDPVPVTESDKDIEGRGT